MAGLKSILMDVLTLTGEVNRLNKQTEKLSERTIEIDKRVVRLETMIEIGKIRGKTPKSDKN